jgi:hypothetical protein
MLIPSSLARGDDAVARADAGDDGGLGLRDERLRGRVGAGDRGERAVRDEERALNGDASRRGRLLEGDDRLANDTDRVLCSRDAGRGRFDCRSCLSVTGRWSTREGRRIGRYDVLSHGKGEVLQLRLGTLEVRDDLDALEVARDVANLAACNRSCRERRQPERQCSKWQRD